MNVKKHMGLLGLRIRDKVTGYEGVVTSVSFDLYGCIQIIINPGQDKDGKLRDQIWLDVARLEVLDTTPVMPVPNYDYGPVAPAVSRAYGESADLCARNDGRQDIAWTELRSWLGWASYGGARLVQVR